MDSEHTKQLVCQQCGVGYPAIAMVHYCSCGNRIIYTPPTTTPRKDVVQVRLDRIKKTTKANPRAVAKIKVCIDCPAGHYDKVQDRCIEIIRIGLRKKPPQERAGIVTPYLLAHPNVSCPLGYHDEVDKEYDGREEADKKVDNQ